MADLSSSSIPQLINLQHRLKLLIEGATESWTYAIFWESSGADLRWGNGFYVYKGEENNTTRKTVSSPSEQEHRKECMRKLNASIYGSSGDAFYEKEVTDTEWFFLLSMADTFPNGSGLPGRALTTSSPVWVTGVESLRGYDCGRAQDAREYGLQTVVWIPSSHGVVELGSTELNFQRSDLMVNRVKFLFNLDPSNLHSRI